jgi:diacylglycerol kinase family enzyme
MAEATSADLRSVERQSVSVRRAVVLANAGAGAFNQALSADLRWRLADALAQTGIAADIRYVRGGGLREAARALAEARRGEIDAVIIGGGDGSVRAVASVLAGTEVPLGIVPLGTRNHFARDLRLPLEVEDAAVTIAAGQTRLVDLGEVNGETFINNSSIGIYPYLVIERERRRAAIKTYIFASFYSGTPCPSQRGLF